MRQSSTHCLKALLPLAILVPACGEQGPQEAKPRLLPVLVQRVEAADSYQLRRHYTGLLKPRQSTALAFELGGRIASLEADVGERVQAGQLLATLDTRRLDARKSELKAGIRSARARLDELVAGPRKEVIAKARAETARLEEELKLARLQLQRREELRNEEAGSEEKVDVARTSVATYQAQLEGAQSSLAELLAGTRKEQLEIQRAKVAQLEAQLGELEVSLEDSRLHAPYAGTVARREVDLAAVVTAGQTVLELVETEQLEAWIGVPQKTAATLEVGTTHRLRLGDLELDVELARVLPQLDERTRSVTLVFEISGQAVPGGGPLRPGQLVRLELTQEVRMAGYWLPLTALAESPHGLWSCYLVVEEKEGGGAGGAGVGHRIARAELEMLHVQGEKVLVRGTLKPGDLVVQAGTQRVVPGQLIAPKLEDQN